MNQYHQALAYINGTAKRYVVLHYHLLPTCKESLRNDGYFCSTFGETTIVSKLH